MKITYAKLDGDRIPLPEIGEWVLCRSNDIEYLFAFKDDWKHGPFVKFLTK